MTDVIARRCFVSGRVQGVFYRASTRQKATELGVSGYAINLDDGRVEVLAIGPSAAVQALIDWLWIGPPSARVAGVVVEEVHVELEASDQKRIAESGWRVEANR
jgi:acylphosphatase